MALVPESNINNYKDYSRSGCRSRKVNCYGEAASKHVEKSKAISEAKAEAERQRDLAIDQAKEDISCPANGCDKEHTCEPRGDWYTDDNYGYRQQRLEKLEKENLWYAKFQYFKEIKLKCRCVKSR